LLWYEIALLATQQKGAKENPATVRNHSNPMKSHSEQSTRRTQMNKTIREKEGEGGHPHGFAAPRGRATGGRNGGAGAGREPRALALGGRRRQAWAARHKAAAMR